MVKFHSSQVYRLALTAILAALTFALKMAMAGLPNIEPVSTLIMVYAVTLGPWAMGIVAVYVLLEFAVWGLNIWSVCYLYIWPLLWLIAWLLRRMRSRLGWAMVCGVFGLAFGALSAPVSFVIGGWQMALSYWINGITFDLLHGAGNFAISLLCFVPLRRLMERLLGMNQTPTTL